MAVSTIQRLSLPVANQDVAKAFYVDLLGFEVLGDTPVPMGDNARWIELGGRAKGASLVLVTWLPTAPGGVQGLMLESSDLDADCERLRAAGHAVQGPNPTPWGRQASFSDPDGNGLVLVEAAA